MYLLMKMFSHDSQTQLQPQLMDSHWYLRQITSEDVF